MQLVSFLASGVRGAENGTAEVYVRGTSQRANYYLDFEATQQVDGNVDVSLDSYGRALIYVTQLVNIVVKDSNGTPIFTDGVVQGGYDANLEVRSPSFTGTDYIGGASGVGKPTTQEAINDAWIESAGATDWKVLFEGSATLLSIAIATIAGYFENVKAATYGAVGDGVTDDTSAIQAALDAAAVSGRLVFFPPGTYRVTSLLTAPALTWPPGVSLLGCGPSKSIITVDDVSGPIFTCAADETSTQSARDIAFEADQAHAGSLIRATDSGKFIFSGCRFGNSNTIGASGEGYLKSHDDAISPQFSLSQCEFVLPANSEGACHTRGTTTARTRVLLTNCSVVLEGDRASAVRLFVAHQMVCNGCSFDISAAAAGSSVRLLGSESSGTGKTIAASGNEVTETGGASAVFIDGNGGADIAESANRVPSSVALITNFTGGGESSLGSRKNRTYEVSHGSTSNLDLSDAGLSAEVIHVTITSNDNFTIVPPSPTNIKGLELELHLENQAGGATGTITYSASGFAGLTSVTGTAPPTSIAANGTIVSARFRALDGPDGTRWYPVGGAYAGT